MLFKVLCMYYHVMYCSWFHSTEKIVTLRVIRCFIRQQKLWQEVLFGVLWYSKSFHVACFLGFYNTAKNCDMTCCFLQHKKIAKFSRISCSVKLLRVEWFLNFRSNSLLIICLHMLLRLNTSWNAVFRVFYLRCRVFNL